MSKRLSRKISTEPVGYFFFLGTLIYDMEKIIFLKLVDNYLAGIASPEEQALLEE